jgi:two-component system sensor histidine kinase CreC
MDGAEATPEKLREAFRRAHERTFKSKIFDHLKTSVGIHAYMTDVEGRVLFDSEDGKREGLDYSQMRDVSLTLEGNYGARSSRNHKLDSTSSVLYVAAPIGDPTKPTGVLTVYKPQADVLPLIRERKRIIYMACAMIGGGIIVLIGVVFLWLFRPIGQITEYARAVERGERPKKPRIGIGREVNTLAKALDSMRDALEGRRYAQHYIQTLTHEMKSPLAAIRGAAELLNEEMPLETRQRFLGNILDETARSERLINRLLELSAIESRASLEQTEQVNLHSIVDTAIAQAKPLADLAKVTLEVESLPDPLELRGDAFILRAAILNLLENAIDFSPSGGLVRIAANVTGEEVILTIRDCGPGIPDYAKEKIFDRFYSLRHHSMGRKGTGLGLTLVREAAELHGGTIALEPAEGGGTIATFTLALR